VRGAPAAAAACVRSDVTQFCFSILCSTGLDQVLSDAQVMGLFFAAIAHDLGHR
jgi:hypothetical protein